MLSLLPSVLRFAPWVLAGLAVAAALWFRAEAASCRASVAIEAAKAEEAVRQARDADAAATRIKAEEAAKAKAELAAQAQAAFQAIARAKSDPNCARTPAAGAFDAAVTGRGK